MRVAWRWRGTGLRQYGFIMIPNFTVSVQQRGNEFFDD